MPEHWSRRKGHRGYPQLTEGDWLRHEYVDRFRTARDIAVEVGCSKATVQRALHDRGIPIRVANLRHGCGHHPLYRPWHGMVHRCYDTNGRSFPNYGGRGITVYEPWLHPKAFIEDMAGTHKPGYHLHRIDNDGNYEPGNVEWLSPPAHRRAHGARVSELQARIRQLETALLAAGMPVPADPYDAPLAEAARDRGVLVEG